MNRGFHTIAAAAALTLAGASAPGAAELPKSTQKVMAELKVDPSLMNGLEAELRVPKAWIDGAAKEEQVVILGTWPNRQFRTMAAPFRERYPNVKLNYHRSGTRARGLNVVIALKEGRVIGDVITSFADSIIPFKNMKALADLSELPGIKNVPADHVAPDKTWVSHKISYRCLGFNTKSLKQADLPSNWDDLLTNKLLRGGKLAVTNHPNSWLLGLWHLKGEKWGENFINRLFEDVRPQQRKEGMSAATALTVAGEFNANLPAPEWQIRRYMDKGAPVQVACPEPVPMTVSPIAMLNNSPNKNGARLFINWVLSREGQLLQYYKSYVIPAHKDLDQPRFNSVFELVKGKKKSIRDDAILGSEMHKKMLKMWNAKWTNPVGKGRKKKGRKKKKKNN
jgi:iron(III) transport system substrate-binding protein